MKKAIWTQDYDIQEDTMYDHPGCPDCETPIEKYKDGEFHCMACGNKVRVEDPEMIKWFKDREGTKVEMWDCDILEFDDFKQGCGGKGCMEVHFHKNPVTLKWQVSYGKCKKCGARFIV